VRSCAGAMDTERRIAELEKRVEALERVVGTPFLSDSFRSISERVRRLERGEASY